jgi:hypothetical protein
MSRYKEIGLVVVVVVIVVLGGVVVDIMIQLAHPNIE